MLIRNLIGHTLPVENALSRVVDVSEEIHSSSRRRCACSSTMGSSDDSRAKWEVSGALSTIAIPPTIHALLATRLDRLGDEEQAVIERASVVGRVFGWGAVAELSPPEIRSELSAHLRSLLDKELIRPDTEVGQEDAFRFAHQLIRDAAYRAIPKAVRADLHERLADWFEARASERPGEYDEILGHHTEQAYQSLLELGPMTRASGWDGGPRPPSPPEVGARSHRATCPPPSAGCRGPGSCSRSTTPTGSTFCPSSRSHSLRPAILPGRRQSSPRPRSPRATRETRVSRRTPLS